MGAETTSSDWYSEAKKFMHSEGIQFARNQEKILQKVCLGPRFNANNYAGWR